jgi:hypothetical protein
MESLRRSSGSGKGSFISRRAAARPVLNKSRSEAILHALPGSTGLYTGPR